MTDRIIPQEHPAALIRRERQQHAHAYERRVKTDGTFTKYRCRHCGRRMMRGKYAI